MRSLLAAHVPSQMTMSDAALGKMSITHIVSLVSWLSDSPMDAINASKSKRTQLELIPLLTDDLSESDAEDLWLAVVANEGK